MSGIKPGEQLKVEGQGASAGRQEPILRPKRGVRLDRQTELASETAKLQECVGKLGDAMRFEGIDAHTPLGVWCEAQQAAMLSLGQLVEMQTIRIEERAEAVQRSWQAQADVHAKAIEELRAATQTCRAETAHSEAKRKADGQLLTHEVATGIKQVLADTMVVREIRWNRRQNWMAAALAAVVLLSFFICGGVWTSYRFDRGTISRCLTKQVLDTAGRQYCPMDVVRGAAWSARSYPQWPTT